MPLPTIEGKTKEQFINECIPLLIAEGKTQEEAIAICNRAWEESQGQQPIQTEQPQKKKGKIELLSDFKKQLEKNGIELKEERLLELVMDMQTALSIDPVISFKLNSDVMHDMTEQEIQIFPRKKVWIDKYQRYIDFNQAIFQDIIDNFNNPKLFRPFIDEDHKRGIKYADVTALTIKPDGLFGNIKLNDIGMDVVKNNKYSYISPDLGPRTDTDKVKHNNVLFAVTLTNTPALEGENPTLQEQIKLTKGGSEMPKTLQEKILETQTKLSIKLQEGQPGEMVPMASVVEIAELITELKVKIDELTMAKKAAEEIATGATEELAAVQAAGQLSIKEEFFTKVVKEEKLKPDQVDNYKVLYDANPGLVTLVLSSNTAGNGSIQLSNNPAGDGHGLSPEDCEIFASSEYTDIEKFKKEVVEA